jgi:hypothetical protein
MHVWVYLRAIQLISLSPTCPATETIYSRNPWSYSYLATEDQSRYRYGVLAQLKFFCAQAEGSIYLPFPPPALFAAAICPSVCLGYSAPHALASPVLDHLAMPPTGRMFSVNVYLPFASKPPMPRCANSSA